MDIKEANTYINFGIKEGNYAPEDFEGFTDEELIEYAEIQMAKAELAYDAWKEQNDIT